MSRAAAARLPIAAHPARPGLDLVVLGDCNPDVLVLGDDVTPAFGQHEKLVASMSLAIGGSAAITAVAAARLGLRVALVAAVGADPAGEFLLGQLTAAGVDVTAVTVRPGTPTGMTVALSAGDDRAILTALGAVATLTAQDVPAGLLGLARHVHVSSYFLVRRSLDPGLAAQLETARAAAATTSLDPNWDPAGQWGDAGFRAALAQTDLLLPNEAEALRLSGARTLRDAVPELTAGGSALVVKLGARGALCADQAGLHFVEPPAGLGCPVDATGAGDCFNAGLIAGLLRGMDLPAAARLGCAAGTLSTRGAGGTAACPDLPAALAAAEAVTLRPADELAG